MSSNNNYNANNETRIIKKRYKFNTKYIDSNNYNANIENEYNENENEEISRRTNRLTNRLNINENI